MTTTTAASDQAADDAHCAATRYFWGWLIFAASMSLAGNMGHAVLSAPDATRWLAAIAALVPPMVLLAATHSMALLVRTRTVGWVYWVALLATAALALGAFALSFDALRSLGMMLGIRESMSWIWPALIDVAIAHATLCLLSLTRPRRATRMSSTGTKSKDPERHENAHGAADERVPAQAPQPAQPTTGPSASSRPAARIRAPALSAVPSSSDPGQFGELSTISGDVDSAAVQQWLPVAETIVGDGVTRGRMKRWPPEDHPEVVAMILAHHAAGTPPSTVGRRHKVHHTTVGRILEAAAELTG